MKTYKAIVLVSVYNGEGSIVDVMLEGTNAYNDRLDNLDEHGCFWIGDRLVRVHVEVDYEEEISSSD